MEDIRKNYSLRFQPSQGWIAKLGNPHLDELLNTVRENGNQVYIFGVGENGMFIAEQLWKENVQIVSFCDNNVKMQNKTILQDIICINPAAIDRKIPIIVTVNTKHLDEVKAQIQELGGRIIGII